MLAEINWPAAVVILGAYLVLAYIVTRFLPGDSRDDDNEY